MQNSSLDSSQQNNPRKEEKAKGHGRNPHESYTGAETIELSHPDLKAGDPCPLECGGSLYEVPSGVIIRVTGSPIATATRYLLEKLSFFSYLVNILVKISMMFFNIAIRNWAKRFKCLTLFQ